MESSGRFSQLCPEQALGSLDSSVDDEKVTEVLVSTFVSRLYDDPDPMGSGGTLRFQEVL